MNKLLQINVTSNWGSTGKIAETIGLGVKRRGWDSYLAYGRYHNPSGLHTIKIGGKLDNYIHFAANRLFDMEGRASANATKQLVRQLKLIKPDVVQLHNLHDHYLNYPLLFEYLNETDIKVVWTFHDCWAFTGHCYHFVECGCKKWQKECGDCPMRNRFFDRSRENFLLKKELFTANKNMTVVAVSNWLEDLARQSFLKDKDIRVIPNGVDLNVFKPTEGFTHPKIKDNTFVIMAVSSQWKNNGKGLPDYKAMSSLLKEDERMILVGVPEDVIATLPENIIGIRRTNSQQELAALYSRADVVTSFSQAETFGLTIVEGYACGTPAVVYNNTAQPALITPDSGFVVPNKDYESAYEAIQKIKAKGKKSYSKACIALARKRYDKDKCFVEYVKLYEKLMLNNRFTLVSP